MAEKYSSSHERILEDAEFSLRIQNQSLILLLHACANELPLAQGEEEKHRIPEEMLNEVRLFQHERAIFQDCLANIFSEENLEENVAYFPGTKEREKELPERVSDLEKQSAILNSFVQRILKQHFPPDLPRKPVRRPLALQNLEEKIIAIYSAPNNGSTESKE